MRHLRCKCGKITAWTSMGTQDCDGCEDCKTTLAGHPDNHKKLKPHVWKTMYNQSTGKPYKRCSKCSELDVESYKKAQIHDDEKTNTET